MSKVVLEESKFSVLGPLIVQLRFESPDTLLEQTYRAEHLLTLIDPSKQYPYDFICYKLTDYKPREKAKPELIVGRDLIADLATFIGQVTRQIPAKAGSLAEAAISVRQLAQETDISIKTLKRWQKLGLAQRTVIGLDGLCQMCILRSTWQWFIGKHERLVTRAAAFSRLTINQRQWVIIQARKLYQTEGLSRNQIELRLAQKTRRARETIRYILTGYDAVALPHDRIFPAKAKLNPETCRQIFEMFVKGIAIDKLAKIFSRSESTIYRVINQSRQTVWHDAVIEYMYSPEFDLPSAEQTIMPGAQVRIEIKPESQHLQTLDASQERALFRAYNYLKWKQDQLRKPLVDNPKSSLPAAVLDKLEGLQNEVDQVKDKLILTNQALVISIAKRHLNSSLTLDELFSEGLVPLMKAVEKFDYTRGFKFSTYASWAIMKHFARIVPLANQQQHELLGDDELDAILPGMTDVDENEAYQRSQAVQTALGHLNDRERGILENRFGLNRIEEPLSLSQLGKRLGVTKERVRQIESKAMDKLHDILKGKLSSGEANSSLRSE
ncbi:MAG: sigma-70 family RNA polymerase sigma factor [Phycisphaerae bacterium]